MRKRIEPGDGDPRHATANGYGNLRCRCVPCTGAWADYCYQQVQKTRPPLPPGDHRHGTATAYRYWKCKCDVCLDGEADRTRAAYWRRSAS